MFSIRPLSAAAPKASRPRTEGRSPRRRPAAFRLETLEARDLKTGIAGVTYQYGMISIQGPNAAGNSVQVDRIDNSVRVTVNGQTADFDASQVSNVVYRSGASGWDSFSNNTNLGSRIYGYGGHNQFQGSSNFNTVYLYANNNAYNARGGASYVFSYDGPQDNIAAYGNTYVYRYSTAGFSKYF